MSEAESKGEDMSDAEKLARWMQATNNRNPHGGQTPWEDMPLASRKRFMFVAKALLQEPPKVLRDAIAKRARRKGRADNQRSHA